MALKQILSLLCLTASLAAQESPAVQQMLLALEHIGHQLHSQEVDINLFQERMQALEKEIRSCKQLPAEKILERRISSLERGQEALIKDLKNLKKLCNETGSNLALCQLNLQKLDTQLTSDIQTLKASLSQMLALLQPQTPTESSNAYIVQLGDSLGKIAHDHKTDVKTLKKLNNLSSDTIYSGQKLLIP